MNNPSPKLPDPSPLPSGGAVGAATGISAVLGYGASWLATRYNVPPEVSLPVLTGVATIVTSLWHRWVPNP